MARRPEIVVLLEAGDIEGAVAAAPEATGPVGRRLRIERDRLALALAIGDLAGALSLERVIQTLSDFADLALELAIGEAMRQRTPDASPAGFAVIALGKHGSRELNYSSDIDPILIYDPGTIPLRPREDPAEGAVRIAKLVVHLLHTRDGDGYVFRVDLRLRPSPEATQIALPVEAAISYYESSALGWERAAFIRARAAAGDVAMGQDFLAAITPFVWRRSLDFGAVGELRAMSQRIRAHHAAGQKFGPGFDLKRGRGGIREIEFFVQIQQLIRGGRDPALRVPDTIGAIAALAAAGWITAPEANTLDTAYRLFRTIEHRLQMVDDRQTHTLPTDARALDDVARLHGLVDGAALLALLAPHIDAVGTLYDALDSDAPQRVPAQANAAFAQAGYADPAAMARRVADWRSGKVRALRSPAALEALEAALPGLIVAFGAAPDPDDALAAFDRLVSGLPSAINLFRLLEAQPVLRQQLVEILSHAPTLAEALGRRPALLDRLIDATAFDPVGDVATLVAEMHDGSGDVEAQFDRVRHIVGDHRFALGTQIVEGRADPIAVAAGYARVAEAALVSIAQTVIADFEGKHGVITGSELVVLALGRFGGGLLTHASDLDLVYLFTGDFQSESDGKKPLGASHYYNRLAQRLTAGLSVATSAGALYEVDTRLRPSGKQGPLVVSFDSFARYQSENAWTWEHMALTRARPVFGSATARAELATIIGAVLRTPRDVGALATAVVAMRSDIAAHKPPLGALDVKLAEGGLVDLEFFVHFQQLANVIGLVPDLRDAIVALSSGGVAAPELRAAHDLMTRVLVTLRLVSPAMDVPAPATCAVVARACGADDWTDLMARLDVARASVKAHWNLVVEKAKTT
ncbi:bifunctional [glutamine synthetase] adenylyltransferase/[glutamine synthetase]-adenylyl-L-tyrosine phosphorylase [Sphingomonas sp.]|uniref:bifunctional [glutamine synthetase] adenylyltransferase/[glutamine synthetase]-adenylyl-L-tyrosine phosphorylase n=1 Tax=Sphingomonas sp. TaxID=28214 RepID=UPI0025D36167|nr:bifunctional [glutamine synthetase] adenylyltransferase/[glutamine synthetase]-adenylyl-L-tyrosine phosphorylase [Sphingomonas sp.]